MKFQLILQMKKLSKKNNKIWTSRTISKQESLKVNFSVFFPQTKENQMIQVKKNLQ